jgi:hypothetical protein
MDHAACQSLQKAGVVELLDDGVVVLEGTCLNRKRRARGEKIRPKRGAEPERPATLDGKSAFVVTVSNGSTRFESAHD